MVESLVDKRAEEKVSMRVAWWVDKMELLMVEKWVTLLVATLAELKVG